jgi:hypothetical protein
VDQPLQYTAQFYELTVPPAGEVSVLYSFFPNPGLEPRDFGLVARVFYQLADGSGNFSNVFYNGSIILEEPIEPLDAQT